MADLINLHKYKIEQAMHGMPREVIVGYRYIKFGMFRMVRWAHRFPAFMTWRPIGRLWVLPMLNHAARKMQKRYSDRTLKRALERIHKHRP